MSQQMVNGSYYKGNVTVTNRMTYRYAVVNPPNQGKHRKTEAQRFKRDLRNRYEGFIRNSWKAGE